MGYPTSKTGAPQQRSPRQRQDASAQAERVQDLLGERNNPEGRAVTVAMAAALGQVALKAKKLTAAPSAADYNNLVDDLTAIAATLNQMGARFTGV